MTRFATTAMTTALMASVLAACATPDYPVKAGYVAPPPITPQYPVHQEAPPAASPPAAAPPSAPPLAAAPAAAVESQPLAPVASTAETPVTQPTPAPTTVAPAPTPVTPAPSPPAASPPVANIPATPVRYTAAGKVVTPKGMYRDYVVVKGDHVDLIARDLKSSRAELIEANHLKPPYEIDPGQHLRIPVTKAYEAQSGDTLAVIARRFGVEVGDLADLNDLTSRAKIKSGMLIALPSDARDQGPVRMGLETPYHYNAGVEASGGTSTPAYVPPKVEESSQIANQAEVVSAAQGRFIWPVRGDIISGFGVIGIGRKNDGIDIRAAQGASVHAAAAGNVVYAGNQVPGFGNLVLVKHTDGWVTAYAHLDKISVQMRQMVTQGQELGLVGDTGGVSEPQLHFEVRYAPSAADKAKPLDPQLVLPK